VFYQFLVGSVVIDVELDREDHDSIHSTAIGRTLKHLMAELTPEPNLTSGEKEKKVVILLINRIY
jgi:hypothetical protein